MNAPVNLATPLDEPAADSAEAPSHARLERQLERLDRLAEAGMEMIEALTAQAKGTGPKVVDGDVALAFSRVARAVRMTELLQNELSGDLKDPQAAAQDAAKQAEAGLRAAHRDRAVRIVRRVARDHCRREPFAVSAIAREAAERLDDDDIYALVASRPVGELVALLCRDFGLEPNWDSLAAEAWAQAEIDSGAPGSPFLDDDEEDADDPPDSDREPDPERRVHVAKTSDAAVAALARDPEIIAAARRDTG